MIRIRSCVVTHACTPHEYMHARNLNMTNRSSLLLSTSGSKKLHIFTYIYPHGFHVYQINLPNNLKTQFFLRGLQQVKSLFRRGQAHLALGNFPAATETLGCLMRSCHQISATVVVTRLRTPWLYLDSCFWAFGPEIVRCLMSISINMVILCKCM